jgi:hypothetical protein
MRPPTLRPSINTLPASCIWLIGLVPLVTALYLARAGLNITDESSYLNTFMFPDHITTGLSKYDRLIPSFSTNIIVSTRIFGYLLLSALSITLSISILQIFKNISLPEKAYLLPISLLSAQVPFLRLPQTPSYNTLTTALLIILTIGFILSLGKERGQGESCRYKPLIFFAVGAMSPLAILVRPPLIVALAPFAFSLYFHHRNDERPSVHVLLPCLVTGTIASAITIHMFWIDLYETIFIQFPGSLSLIHELGNFYDRESVTIGIQLSYLLVASGVLIIGIYMLTRDRQRPIYAHHALSRYCVMACHFSPIIIYLYLISGGMNFSRLLWPGPWLFDEYLIMLLPVTLITYIYVHYSIPSSSDWWRRVGLMTTALLIYYALCSSLGTNNSNLISHSLSIGGGLWIIAIALLFLVMQARIPLWSCKWGLLGLAATSALFYIGHTNAPYAIPGSLWQQTEEVEFRGGTETLLLDPATARYVRDLTGAYELMHRADAKRPYLVDLTGVSPAANVIVDAPPPGIPWLIGGFEGSEKVAVRLLRALPVEDVRAAWIVVDPDGGPRSLNPDILELFAMRYPRDYEVVASTRTGHLDRRHIVMRPSERATVN